MICRRQYSSVENALRPLAFIPLGMSQAQQTQNNSTVLCGNIPNGMCCHRGWDISTELQSLTGFHDSRHKDNGSVYKMRCASRVEDVA